MAVEHVITAHIETWTAAIRDKKAAGRGGGGKRELYGVKKLRELILELAIQGLIVDQDPSDTSAIECLSAAHSQRDKWIKEKRYKKPKLLNPVDKSEYPHPLPKGWLAVRLNDLGDWGAGATPKRSEHRFYGGDIPWFKSGELSADRITTSEETITELALDKTSLRLNAAGDVLVAMYGATIGKASILEREATTNQAVCACTPWQGAMSNEFLLVLLKASRPRFRQMGAGGAQPNISREKIIATAVGMPPLAEQHRIVAKVDELMALCDQLEQQQENSLNAHQTLVQTLLSALATATEREGFNSAWARIADHFHTLFTTPDSIQQLRQTLLQLAVMGFLSTRLDADESARAMLERLFGVTEEKSSINSQLERLLPSNWSLLTLGDLEPEFQNGASSRGDKQGEQTIVLRLADISNWEIDLSAPRTIVLNDQAREKYSLRKNDVLAVRVNGSANYVGRFVLVRDDRNIAYCDHFIRMRFDKLALTPRFVTLLGASPLVRDRIEELFVSTAGQKTINQKHLRSLAVPVPPLPEQNRIVAKADELMALCDRLQTAIEAAQATRLQLADAVAQQAVAA